MNEPRPTLTYAEFLDFVATHPDDQYEYVSGHPVAMGRPSTMHQRITGELFAGLKAHLRGQRCDVYFAVRVWLGERDRVPDIAATCDEYDIAEAANIIHSPKLIIEVLGPNRGDHLDVKIKQYESRSSIRNTSSSIHSEDGCNDIGASNLSRDLRRIRYASRVRSYSPP